MQKPAGLLRSPRRLAGVVIVWVGAVLLLASITGALRGSPPAPTAASSPPEDAAASGAASAVRAAAADEPPPTAPPTPKPSPNPQTQTTNPHTQGANAPTTPATETADKPQPATIAVSLSINGSRKGEVSIEPGKNHCDVLNQALADGTIDSLDLRWNAAWKTYGVYKINGQGEDNTINWVYEVNGKSPHVGCSLAKPAAGDTINWKYLK